MEVCHFQAKKSFKKSSTVKLLGQLEPNTIQGMNNQVSDTGTSRPLDMFENQ